MHENPHDLSFEKLLPKDNSVSVHPTNLDFLAIEKSGTSPDIMNNRLRFIEKAYNFLSNFILKRKREKTIYYGSEGLSSLATRIWDLMPNFIKNINSLPEIEKSNQSMNNQQMSK